MNNTNTLLPIYFNIESGSFVYSNIESGLFVNFNIQSGSFVYSNIQSMFMSVGRSNTIQLSGMFTLT